MHCKDASERLERILRHYEANFGKGLDNHQILDWESAEAQFSRFSVLIEYVELGDHSLLDVGCGLGDLYAFFQEISLSSIRYTGIDLSEKMITHALGRFPGADFRKMDLFADPAAFADSSYDVVFSSGIFNLNLGNNMEFLRKALTEFYRISRSHIVFNLLSEKSNDKEPAYFYYREKDVEDLIRCFGFSSARIVEDYLLNDITVICAK